MANEVRIKVIAEDRASGPIGKVKNEAGGLSGAFQSAQRNWLALGAAIGAADGARRVIGGMVSAASDLEESLSKNRVVFGEFSSVVEDFSKTSASAFGLSKNEALAATGAFGNMFNTIGLVAEDSAKMSVSMTQLAADMASFNNEDPSDMLLRLRSGLAGEAEPLRKFGVLLSEAETKAFAYRTGIAAVGSALTEAEKVQARYGLILEQTAVQQGDFARTSGGLANQLRILNAEMDNLQADIGAFILPAFTSLVSEMNDAIRGARMLGDALRDIPRNVGVNIDVDDGGTGLFDALKSAAINAVGGPVVSGTRALAGLGRSGEQERPSGRAGLTSGASGAAVSGDLAGVAAAFVEFRKRMDELKISADDLTTGAGGGGGLAALRIAEEARGHAAELAEAALKAVAQAEDERAALLRATVERQTSEVVEAYIRGGDAAVEQVRAKQTEMNRAWESMASDLHQKFGIDVPENFRRLFETIRSASEQAAVHTAGLFGFLHDSRRGMEDPFTGFTHTFAGGGSVFVSADGSPAPGGGPSISLEQFNALGGVLGGLPQFGGAPGAVIKVVIGDREFKDAVVESVTNATRTGEL